MGLSIAGEWDAAERAYHWLADQQLEDGSWWACYRDGQPDASVEQRETNYVAYISTGVWHHFLITGDDAFLRTLFPVVQRAMDFVLQYQSPEGEIDWAVDPTGAPLGDALVTGCSSIYKSLECAILIAETLGQQASSWRAARARLGDALRHHPAIRPNLGEQVPVRDGLVLPDSCGLGDGRGSASGWQIAGTNLLSRALVAGAKSSTLGDRGGVL